MRVGTHCISRDPLVTTNSWNYICIHLYILCCSLLHTVCAATGHGQLHHYYHLNYHFLSVSIITSTAQPEHYATHTVLVKRHAGRFLNNYYWDEVNYSSHTLQLVINQHLDYALECQDTCKHLKPMKNILEIVGKNP